MKLVILDQVLKIFVQKTGDNMKYLVTVITLIGLSAANAKVDIDYKLELLDKNVKNSEANFEKFKENLSISVKNFNEATRTVNELRNLKKQAILDKKRSNSNSLTYASVMDKYNEFIAQEQANILKEVEAAKKLEELLAKVRQNTEKRKELIANYNKEIQLTKQEIENWRTKEREVASVIQDIDKREVGALEERKIWEEKKEAYKSEAKKWANEVKGARRTYSVFTNLRK